MTEFSQYSVMNLQALAEQNKRKECEITMILTQFTTHSKSEEIEELKKILSLFLKRDWSM